MIKTKAWLRGICRYAAIQWQEGDVPTYMAGLRESDEKKPGFVTIYEPEYYAKNRVFTSPDGKQGFALLAHGDGRIEIAGIFNNDPEAKGAGKEATRRGFQLGGNYLEAFEADPDLGRKGAFSLPHYYNRQVGAEPVGYLPFDPQYAHPKWDYEQFGRPGIVSLSVPPGAHDDPEWLAKKHDNFAFHDQYVRMREEAISKRDEAMKRKKDDASRTASNVTPLRVVPIMPADPVEDYDEWERQANLKHAARKAALAKFRLVK